MGAYFRALEQLNRIYWQKCLEEKMREHAKRTGGDQ